MLAKFRFEYEWLRSKPSFFGVQAAWKRWTLFHDLVPIQAEVFSLAEAHDYGLELCVPGYDGLRLIFLTGLDRVLLAPWAPARPHPDVDRELMARIETRESPLMVNYPSGRTWLHVPGDSALAV